MAFRRISVVLVGLLASVTGSVAAGEAAGVDRYELECVPVATIWPVPAGWERSRPGPELAVVDTHVRPKRAHLLLDGRPIGSARAFDGSPDYLYLEPGRYRLEVHLGGYRSAVFEVDARAGCRYDIRHRMTRLEGTPKEGRAAGVDGPVQRVWSPVRRDAKGPGEGSPAVSQRGPDLALRPDLRRLKADRAPSTEGAASLQLRVRPLGATVRLDGEVVATGSEIAAMHQPLRVTSGPHLLEVSAPGYLAVSTRFDLTVGEHREISIDLETETGEPAPETVPGAGQAVPPDVYSR